jgi:hypothetical protein
MYGLQNRKISFLYLIVQNFKQEFRRFYLKQNQLDAQFIFSIFRQAPLRVSGVSIAYHQEEHCMDTAVGTYWSF